MKQEEDEDLVISDDVLSCLLNNLESDDVSQFSESNDSSGSVEICTIKIPGKTKNTIVVVSNSEDRIVESKYASNSNRKRKRAKLEKVEVVRVDVRNTFALMMANVYNTMDFNKICGMLRTYSVPDAPFCMNRTKGDVFSVNFTGPVMMANALYSNLSIYPDCVTTLLSSSFDVNTGIIAYTLEFTMTKVFNYQTILKVLPKMVVEPTTSQASVSSSDGTSNSASDTMDDLCERMSESKIVEKVLEMKDSLPLRQKPVVVVVRAKVVLRTNDEKRIVEGKTTLITIKNE